jgi:DNA repair protein RadC
MKRQAMENLYPKVSEIELIYKSKVKAIDRPTVRSSSDAYHLFLEHWDKNKIEYVEQFKAMFLNRANRVLAIYEVSSGGISETVADPKQIFTAALKINSSQVIICHNHPTSNLKPSKSDEHLTETIVQAGKFLKLPVIDHLIVSIDGYLSFADEGLL